MSRYRGPRIRLLKRLGSLPGFGYKINRKKNFKKREYRRRKKRSNFIVRLKEKQRLRYNYGLTEKNLINYVKKTKKQTDKLLQNLELRLDNVVFRLGFAPTLPAARQLVTHGHILLNGKKRDIPSSQCEINDVISTTLTKKKIIKPRRLPTFLSLNSGIGKIQKIPSSNDIFLRVRKLFITEYYSRKL